MTTAAIRPREPEGFALSSGSETSGDASRVANAVARAGVHRLSCDPGHSGCPEPDPGVGVAVPLSANAAANHPVERLTLVETSDAVHVIDVPAAPADGKAGKLSTFESTLKTTAGKKAGRLEGHCIQIRANGSLDDCDVTVTVGTKSFRMSGPFNPTTGSPLTITGGTGAWTGAAGTDSIRNRPDGTAVHTITLMHS